MTEPSAAFERTCEILEAASSLARSEARGTVRHALREAGLEPHTVDCAQMVVVAEKILFAELISLRQPAEDVVAALLDGLRTLADGGPAAESPEVIFRHLAGDTHRLPS